MRSGIAHATRHDSSDFRTSSLKHCLGCITSRRTRRCARICRGSLRHHSGSTSAYRKCKRCGRTRRLSLSRRRNRGMASGPDGPSPAERRGEHKRPRRAHVVRPRALQLRSRPLLAEQPAPQRGNHGTRIQGQLQELPARTPSSQTVRACSKRRTKRNTTPGQRPRRLERARTPAGCASRAPLQWALACRMGRRGSLAG
jgi:hypothetical protein